MTFRLILYIIFMLNIFSANAQDSCPPVYKLFDTGRAKIWHATNGEFWKAPQGGNGFEVDDAQLADIPIQVADGAGLWMIGVDDGGNFKSSLPAPVGNGWHPGPLNDQGHTTPELCNNYNKIWEVTQADLVAHALNFAGDQSIDKIPFNIRAWPGRNNPFFEQANGFPLFSSEEYAPFWDYGDNGVPDGNYDPEKGDFPKIEWGCEWRDVALMHWWIFNDVGLSPIADPIRVEVQAMAFSFDIPASENTTIFYDLKVVNRAIEPINDLRLAYWMKPALGCPEDDFFGSDSTRNLVYVYNGDGEDGMGNCLCDSDNIGFCQGNPILGFNATRGPLDENFNELGLSSINYFVQDENADSSMKPPESFEEYRNYMDGKWRDGNPMTAFGNGLNTEAYEPTNFVFADAPDNEEGWSMCNAQVDISDPVILATYEVFSLWPGTKNFLTFSIVVTEPVDNGLCGSIDPLLEAYESIYERVDCIFDVDRDSATIEPELLPEILLEVYPNPASDYVIIKAKDGQKLKEVRLIDSAGRIINEFLDLEQEELRIDHPALNGIFFLQLLFSNNRSNIHKIFFHT